MRKLILMGVAAATLGASAMAAQAQTMAISIGIRETVAGGGPVVPIGENGGTLGGIEFVNLDGQSLVLDGTWQTFTFNFQNDPLTAFAGTTANSLYDGTRGVLEMVRIRNSSGVTQPVTLWIDHIVNTTAAGGPTVVSDFEGFPVGSEVTFQEPGFSGSTAANVLPGSSSLVTDQEFFLGAQSDELNMQFVDATDTRWVRLTTFGTPNLPNPAIDFANGSSLTFAMKGVVVPEPVSASIFGLASGFVLLRRRH